MNPVLLAVDGLSKTFTGQKALDDVSFDVRKGEVLAIVGQNGSGKSTLIKILSGFHEADPGSSLTFAGEKLDGARHAESMHFIHQDMGLIEGLSTVENLSLGRRVATGPLGGIRTTGEAEHARALLAEFGGAFDVRAPISELAPAHRTLVAIARALQGWEGDDQLLVLDEPTAALHSNEADLLFAAVRRVRARGAGIIFVSHRLEEVLAIADRIAVLRDGRLVEVRDAAGTTKEHLISALAGRELDALYTAPPAPGTEVVLDARGVGGRGVSGFDLELRAGEVVGVTGIMGSGREHIPELLFGQVRGGRGSVHVGSSRLSGSWSVRRAIRNGLAYVPADRPGRGAVLAMSARENMTLPRMRNLWRRGVLDQRQERREAASWVSRLDVHPPLADKSLGEFSGGNQQKVVLAKWLRNDPSVLLLDEPTQGVDVGAKAAIYALLAEAASGGMAILISSSEAKDLSEVCDRVLVMREGAVVAELSGTALTDSRIIRESLGSSGDHLITTGESPVIEDET